MGCGGGCELVGALVLSPGGVSPVYTKPMARGGESALVSIEVSEFVTASVGLEVIVQTKNSEDVSWTTAGTFSSITSAGVYSRDVTSFRQFVRLRINFASGSSQGDTARVGAINFSWRPY